MRKTKVEKESTAPTAAQIKKDNKEGAEKRKKATAKRVDKDPVIKGAKPIAESVVELDERSVAAKAEMERKAQAEKGRTTFGAKSERTPKQIATQVRRRVEDAYVKAATDVKRLEGKVPKSEAASKNRKAQLDKAKVKLEQQLDKLNKLL